MNDGSAQSPAKVRPAPYTPDVDLSLREGLAFCDLPLMSRPGFLIRRLHQIHIALFLEECAGVDITPVQYTLLSIIKQAGEIEQSQIAAAAGMDRANISDVLLRLRRRKLIRARVNPAHKRRRLVSVTDAGIALLRRVNAMVARTHERTVRGLNAEERALFLRLLRTVVERNIDLGRAPLRLS